MRTVRQILVGIFCVALLVGMGTMVSQLESEARASIGYNLQAALFEENHAGYQLIFVTDKKHKDDDDDDEEDDQRLRVRHTDLREDHEEIDSKQNMIKESLDVLEGNQARTHEWLEKIEGMLQPKPVCPEGGAADPTGRYVTYEADLTDRKKVCDQNSGLFWEQDPDSLTRGRMILADALLFCPTLGPGWRLPEIHELVGVVDYTTILPAVNLWQSPYRSARGS